MAGPGWTAGGSRHRWWRTSVRRWPIEARQPRARRARPGRVRTVLARLTLALALPLIAAAAIPAARADELKPFEASYAWIWHGMAAAVTNLKLEKTGDTWTYTSRSEPRGVGKLMPQRPKTVSVLRVTAAGVEPLSSKGDDGTSSPKRSIDVTYDWEHQRITGVYEQTPVDLQLEPGVQDDSSVQIALMVELLSGRT